jgi:hypothetical protein
MLTPDELDEARQHLQIWKPGQCMSDLADAHVIRVP